MLPIHTILHPTDFSDRSGNALPLACALARDYAARLVVLHVAQPTPLVYGEGFVVPDPDETVREERERLQNLLVPVSGIPVEKRFVEGDPADRVLDVAREIRADLIVMGTHGRTGLKRLLMGSVAEQVVRKAVCPVLTVTTPFLVDAPATAALEAATA
jgi:nucleotide-binding universal stress UspA family protein